MTTRADHRFVFNNYGGVYQLRLETADDLAALQRLDEPFWVAMSAPIAQFTCDPALLERLDADFDGRIRSVDIRNAAAWLLKVLRALDGITQRSDILELEALNREDGRGLHLYEGALRITQNLGMSESGRISCDQLRNRSAIFAQGQQNGDGVIPSETIEDPDLRAFAQAILDTMGGVSDRSGAVGVDRSQLDAFISNARMLLTWHDHAATDPDQGALLPFGPDTPERYRTYSEAAPLLDTYFRQCELAAFAEALGRPAPPPPVVETSARTEDEANAYFEQAPLAPPRAEGVFRFDKGINPLYRPVMTRLNAEILPFLLGRRFDGRVLTPTQWQTVKAAFAPYEECVNAKQGGEVEAIGIEALRGYVKEDYAERLQEFITEDLRAGIPLDVLDDLEYVILLQREFLDLCTNFVSFPNLYHPERQAMFEAGRMIMDGRVFSLNFRIADVATHSAAAARSGIFLLYSEVIGGRDDASFYIVTPVTRGPVGELGVGKRGVLFDRNGKEWDVRVVATVDNPVSLKEAMLAPFRRIAALVSSKAESLAGSMEGQLVASADSMAGAVEAQYPGSVAPPPAETQATSSGKLRDFALTGGIAVAALGALGSSFAYIGRTIQETGFTWWHMLAAVCAGIALLLIPTFLVALFRLRHQNLSAVLEASGWAINAPMRLTRPLRKLIVQKPRRPGAFHIQNTDLTRFFRPDTKR